MFMASKLKQVLRKILPLERCDSVDVYTLFLQSAATTIKYGSHNLINLF